MSDATCPLCGYYTPIWLSPPPTGCLRSGRREYCKEALNEARALAMRRKVAPEHYDETGTLKPPPSRIGEVHAAMERAGLDMYTGLPFSRAEVRRRERLVRQRRGYTQ